MLSGLNAVQTLLQEVNRTKPVVEPPITREVFERWDPSTNRVMPRRLSFREQIDQLVNHTNIPKDQKIRALKEFRKSETVAAVFTAAATGFFAAIGAVAAAVPGGLVLAGMSAFFAGLGIFNFVNAVRDRTYAGEAIKKVDVQPTPQPRTPQAQQPALATP